MATSNQLVPVEEQPESRLAPEMGLFFKMASDPNVDITKFKDLMALYRDMDTQRRKDAYAIAFKAAQDEMQPVVVDRKNEQTGSMYATLERVSTAINPIIKRHGFTMSYGSKEPATAGNICVTCRVRHIGGWGEDYQLEGPPDDKGIKGTTNKTGIQGLVSSASYLKRTLKVMIWDITIAGLDHDGNAVLADQQRDNIINMMNACNLTPKGVQNFLKLAGIKDLDSIPRHRYDDLMEALRQKLNAHQERP